MATFGSVVVNHIKNHLDTRSVQLANRGFQFDQNRIWPLSSGGLGSVAHVRGKEVDGVVAPVVD